MSRFLFLVANDLLIFILIDKSKGPIQSMNANHIKPRKNPSAKEEAAKLTKEIIKNIAKFADLMIQLSSPVTCQAPIPIYAIPSIAMRNPDTHKAAPSVAIILPAYSPELNIIEILWRFIKYDWLPFSAYRTENNLINEVDNILRNIGSNFKIDFAC